MFNGVTLIAKVPLTVDGRSYDVGDRFTASAARFGALLVMGRASLAPPESGTEVAHRSPVRRRRYRRRDLTAESSIEAPTE